MGGSPPVWPITLLEKLALTCGRPLPILSSRRAGVGALDTPDRDGSHQETRPHGRGPGRVNPRLALPNLTTHDTTSRRVRAHQGWAAHADSGHRRRRLRRLDPGPHAPGAGPPGPGLRLAQVRRPRPAALLPEPLLRADQGRRQRRRRRQEGARRDGRGRPPRRDRRLPGVQEGAAGRPGDQRRGDAEPPRAPQARPEGHLRLDRLHLRLDPRLHLQREHPVGPDHPLRRDQGRRRGDGPRTPATASPTATPPPSASATGCGST